MNKYRLLILFLFLQVDFAALHASGAASLYRFEHITTHEGLPHQQVNKLIQDDKGKLWIGTRNGLCSYDGYNMTVYQHRRNDPASLCHNYVKALYKDSRGRIWVGTHEGICLYRPESDDFKTFPGFNRKYYMFCETLENELICVGFMDMLLYDEQNETFTPIIRDSYREPILSAAVAPDGRIFYSVYNGIYCFNKERTSITKLKIEGFDNIFMKHDNDNIVPLFFDSRGKLWIGRNDRGAMCVDLQTNEYAVWDERKLSDGIVRIFEEDEYGRIWLGTERGISIIDRSGEVEIIQQSFDSRHALSRNAIRSIFKDKDDNMWIGTYSGGINVLLKSTGQFACIEPGPGETNLKGNVCCKIIETPDGRLWIATGDGGVNIYDPESGRVEKFSKLPENVHNTISLCYDKQYDELWIGSFMLGLFRYDMRSGKIWHYRKDDETGLPADAVFALTQDHDGRIWVGSSQGLRYFDRTDYTFKQIATAHDAIHRTFINSLHVDRQNNIWIGTVVRLYKYNIHKQETTLWNEQSGLSDSYITALCETEDGKMWIGTNAGGLQYIAPGNDAIVQLDPSLGLSDKMICNMLEDHLQQLWIGTSSGLVYLNATRDNTTRFTTAEGLPSNQFQFFSSCLRRDDNLCYFGTVNGLVVFDPEKTTVSEAPLYVRLTQLNIDNETITSALPNSILKKHIDDTEQIRLSYKQSRSFFVEYAAILLGHSSTINYAVKLVGSDEDWNFVGQERKFVGSNLAAGKYTLQIKAFNSFSDLSNAPVKELKIIIRPPFYLSGFAFGIYIVIFIILIYAFFKLSFIRMQDRNMIRLANMEKDKMKEINKIKTDFFTSISHELKMPLSLISAPLKCIVKDEPMSKESQDRINIVLKNTNVMINLIDELTAFNKVETNQMQIYLQEGNPLEFIQNIANLFRESMLSKQLSFSIYLEDNGEIVWFSPSFVEKIVNNLIFNAIKYTPAGGSITLIGTIKEKENAEKYLTIKVEDTGIGIMPEEQERIFENHYQSKRGHNTNAQGWGIGLALTKKLAVLHKGTVSLRSELDKGSCFSVSLNVSENAFDEKNKIRLKEQENFIRNYNFSTPQSNYIENIDTPAQSSEIERQQTILLVDDNDDLLVFLSDFLNKKYNVLTARDGKEALKIVQKRIPDIIISDVAMPKMDGIELCQTLKNDMLTSHIPIILLTARTGDDNTIAGYESGADIYIEKPFDPQALELQIHNILNMKEQNRKYLKSHLEHDAAVVADLNPRDVDFITKLNQLITDNLSNEKFSISDITHEMAISRTVLYVKMNNLLGVSANEYIKKVRLHHAKDLLVKGENIGDAAFQTGFTDPNYFSKCFKKEFGKTPSQFRKSDSK